MTNITFDTINREIRKVAAANPDFVYVTFRKKQLIAQGFSPEVLEGMSINCVYFDEDGKASCLFGTAFHNLGYKADDIQEDTAIDFVLEDNFGITNREQLNFLSSVQSNQDNTERAMTWPQAIAEADEETDEKFYVQA